MNINEKISNFFKERSILNNDIAKKLDVTESTISNYFSGKRQMPLSFVVWFINNYQPNLEELFDTGSTYVTAEPKAKYGQKVINDKDLKLEKILKDIEKTLRKNL